MPAHEGAGTGTAARRRARATSPEPPAPGPSSGGPEAGQVRAMFDRIAGVYDLMNTAMSAGLHHRWRARAADIAAVGPGSRVLDVATGTGDLALELARRVCPGGEVVGADFAEAMLARARAKAETRCAEIARPRFERGDALALPYPEDSFDAATVAFGVRNFRDLRDVRYVLMAGSIISIHVGTVGAGAP